ncbi:MAG: hypothetical protein SOX43_01625 [Pelistega sp.]|nr:hypothetical protein [Pelistega sp.]
MSALISTNLIVGLSPSLRGAFIEHLKSFLPQLATVQLTQAPINAQGMCLCCQLHNETSERLRDLFMQALQRKIPAFSTVLVDCQERVDPSSVAYTLGEDFFLKERYQYRGTILVLDRGLIEQVLVAYEEVVMYFSSTSLIVVSEGLFKDKTEQQAFMAQLEEIYTHVRIFEPDTPSAQVVNMSALTAENWLSYQIALPNRKRPKHRLFL